MTLQIYSTDTDSGLVSVIEKDKEGFRVAKSIEVGNEPRGGVKFTSDGRGFVSNTAGNSISELDVVERREVRRIEIGPAPRGVGIIPGDRYALVSCSGGDYVAVVDLTEYKVIHKVEAGRDPRHMAISADGSYAYVAVWRSQCVSKIDTRALCMGSEADLSQVREVGRIQFEGEVHPYSVAIHPDGKTLFAALNQGTTLPIINLANDEIEAEIDLGGKGARAVAFSPDGKFALVSVEDVSQVTTVDIEKRRIVRRIPVGPGPRGIAVDNAGHTLFAAGFYRAALHLPPDEAKSRMGNAVTVVDLSRGLADSKVRGLRTTSVPVGKGPCSVSIVPTA